LGLFVHLNKFLFIGHFFHPLSFLLSVKSLFLSEFQVSISRASFPTKRFCHVPPSLWRFKDLSLRPPKTTQVSVCLREKKQQAFYYVSLLYLFCVFRIRFALFLPSRFFSM